MDSGFFISGLFLHRKTVRSWTWLMQNATTIDGADLHEITLDELEQLTGLYLWSNVGADQFDTRRGMPSGGDWWMAGQPSRNG